MHASPERADSVLTRWIPQAGVTLLQLKPMTASPLCVVVTGERLSWVGLGIGLTSTETNDVRCHALDLAQPVRIFRRYKGLTSL